MGSKLKWTIAFVFLSVCCIAIQSAHGAPNVVFIISDDLSAEALGSYGNSQCKTPNIDQLASEGVRFTRAYCQFPICGPSRAALMSGRYPQSTGIMRNRQSERFEKVMGDLPSLPEHFRNHDYHTARVSKIYHMRVPGDITAGVDGPDHVESWTEKHNCQGPEWMTEGIHEHHSNDRLKREPDTHYSLGFGSAFYVVRGESDGREQPDVQAATKAIEILERQGDDPFFLAVGLVRPHVPLVAPAPFFEPYPFSTMKTAERVEEDWADIPKAGVSRNAKSMGFAEVKNAPQKILSAYYASVSFMDAQVGRVLDALDRLNLRENTIVVFTSDHGYHLGEHDFWQKMSLHEESARIPLIVSAPGIAAKTSEALAEQIDLYPTLTELAGLSIPAHCQGKSLVPILQGRKAKVREAAYCVTGTGSLIRSSKLAYIAHNDGTTELYDMVADPKQFTNLAELPDYQSIKARLAVLLRERTAVATQSN